MAWTLYSVVTVLPWIAWSKYSGEREQQQQVQLRIEWGGEFYNSAYGQSAIIAILLFPPYLSDLQYSVYIIVLYPPKRSHDLPPLACLYTRKPFQSPGGSSRATGSIKRTSSKHVLIYARYPFCRWVDWSNMPLDAISIQACWYLSSDLYCRYEQLDGAYLHILCVMVLV